MSQPQDPRDAFGVSGVSSPYPGLRPFQRKESLIFFGRDGQVDQMLELLRRVRFLGVVGSSGCGKSSLVKAGLFPALHAGFLLSSNVPWANAEKYPNWVASRWFTVDMRPGAHPFRGLARGLLDSGVLGTTWDVSDSGSVPALAARLQAGPRQLIKLWQKAEESPTGNLLILADQFEELFRFRDRDNFGLAQSFVSLLLQLAAQDDWPIYVAITMRSDFLGECSQFLGLPEALNKGQFLVSRLTTAETREAIERPARMFGVELDSLLMTRMLNDIGNDSDQLPLLQHALKRTWDLSEAGRVSKEPPSKHADNATLNNKSGLLTLADYDRDEIGGVTQALSRHAEELYAKLSGQDENDGEKRLARVMFQALTLRDNGRDVRRPTKLSIVAQIAGADEADVIRIVEVFRHPDCCFLMPPVGTPLTSDAVLDISHESLLRQWKRLEKEWIGQEAQSAAEYERLLDAVRLQEPVLDGLRLDRAVKWRDAQRPTAVWAMRYDGAKTVEASVLPQCLGLITASEQARKDREDAVRIERQEKQAAIERERDLLASQKVSETKRAEAESKRADAETQRARDAEAATAKIQRRTRAVYLAAVVAAVCLVSALFTWRVADNAITAANTAKKTAADEIVVANKAKSDAETAIKAAKDKTAQATKDVEKATGKALYAMGQAKSANEKATTLEQDQMKLVEKLKKFDAQIVQIELFKADLLQQVEEAKSTRDAALREKAEVQAVSAVTQESLDKALQQRGIDAVKANTASAVKDFQLGRGSFEQARRDDASLWFMRALQTNRDDPQWRGSMTNLIGGCASRLRQTMPQDAEVTAIAVSPSGRKIAIASVAGQAQFWDVEAGQVKGVARILRPDPSLTGSPKGDGRVAIRCLAFSHDEKWVATGSSDDTVRLWDFDTGKQHGPALKHGGDVNAVQFSRAGKIVSGSSDKTAKVWELSKVLAATPNSDVAPSIPPLPHGGGVVCLAFNPKADSTLITGSEDGLPRLWDINTGTPLVGSEPHAGGVTSVAFTGDGKKVVTAGRDKKVWLRDATNLRPIGSQPEVTQRHTQEITAIAFSRDYSILATASKDATTRLWDVKEHGLLHKNRTVEVEREGKTRPETQDLVLHHDDEVTSVCFMDTLRLITGSKDKSARLWDAKTTGELRCPPFYHDAGIRCLAVIPDTKIPLLITGSLDGTARLWDLDGVLPEWWNKNENKVGAVLAVDVSSDAKTVVAGMNDRTARTWKNLKGETEPDAARMTHDDRVTAVAFSPTHPWVTTGSADQHVRLFDLKRDEPLWKEKADGDVACVAFSRDGTLIASSGSDRKIRIWKADRGKPARAPSGEHEDSVWALAFDQNAGTVYSGCKDGTLWVWDLKGDTLQKQDARHNSAVADLALSWDGTTLVSGSWDKTAFLWSMKGGGANSGLVVNNILEHKGPVRAVAIAHDGRTVVTGVGYRTSDKASELHFWDTHTGQERSDTIYVTHQLRDVVFTPDGRGVIAGGGFLLPDSQFGYVRRFQVAPPAIDDPQRLQLSVEVRTGKRLDEKGEIRRLKYDEWKGQLEEMRKQGGPCDALNWIDYDNWNTKQKQPQKQE